MSGQGSLPQTHSEPEIPVLPRAVWEATDNVSQGKGRISADKMDLNGPVCLTLTLATQSFYKPTSHQ